MLPRVYSRSDPIIEGKLELRPSACCPSEIRISRGKIFRLVYWPSLTPYLRSALTTAMGLAWKSGVAAEVLCLPRPGIGTEINHAKQAFETADLFAWTAVVIALSLLMERGLRRLIQTRTAGERGGEGRA